MALIDLPYVHKPHGKSHYRYRRKVPKALRDALGQTEIILPLGRTPAEVMRKYAKVHSEAEARLAAAVQGQPVRQTRTQYEWSQWAQRHVGPWGPMGDDERDIAADHIAEQNPTPTPESVALVKALRNVSPPEVSLTDAVRLYLKDRVEGTADEIKKRQRVERVVAHIKTAIGRDPTLTSLSRSDAREVRDHMLTDGGVKPSTVQRYLNDIRAIINHAVKEFDSLAGMTNHFNGLEVKKDTLAKEDRKPFTKDQLTKTRARILDHASTDLQRIWRMLEGTGCRLAEVTGLLVEDVKADAETPYLDLKFHPHRRLKNAGSVRRVPLIGDALAAVQAALGEGGDNALLFPAYGREGGATVASAALMKHVRKTVADPKVTVHSLRHTMKDRLIEADTPQAVQDMILGQSSGAVSEAYGGPEARLKVATTAMKKAFGL
jgi:integrase